LQDNPAPGLRQALQLAWVEAMKVAMPVGSECGLRSIACLHVAPGALQGIGGMTRPKERGQ